MGPILPSNSLENSRPATNEYRRPKLTKKDMLLIETAREMISRLSARLTSKRLMKVLDIETSDLVSLNAEAFEDYQAVLRKIQMPLIELYCRIIG